MTTKVQTNAVANIVRETLAQHFKDEFVFDPIIVEPKIDHDGDKYLNITRVFDGDQKRLDPDPSKADGTGDRRLSIPEQVIHREV